MCGIGGLSIGCGAAPTCPKALILERLAANGRTRDGRYSPLASWEKKASVRTRPHPHFESDADGDLFPAKLVPIADHELVCAADPAVRRRVLASHLFRYLHFTAKLEHLVVNRTLLALANEISGLEVPDWMRLDAYRCTATRRITRSWQPISRAARGCSPSGPPPPTSYAGWLS